MSSNLNVTMYISEEMNNKMVKLVQDVAHRCVMECASKYGFDGEEALRFLNINDIKMERKKVVKSKGEKPLKILTAKAAFPLPYNGEVNENCCNALRQNNGLYTQCTGQKKGDNKFCKSCATTLQKTGSEIPEYGTIEQRKSVGIFEYVDPKGRKPIAYTKIMKKYKISEEDVLNEAGKLNITINPEHFVAPEEDVKRGRPSSKTGEKEPKEKGAKGRPKKSKKVLEIEGEEEDLFASLIAQANEQDEDMDVISKKKSGKSDEEKEAERLAKEEEKAAKKLASDKAKAEKEAKLAVEKAEKEAKLALEKAEKEAKLALEKAEKEAKKEAERVEREAKKLAAEEEKAAKKLAADKAKAEKEAAKKAPKVSAKKDENEDEEPDVVKKIEFEGKKYLKSKKTGIIYDYIEYTKNGDQVVVGKWNEASNKIEFNKSEEEEEEEYDM